MSPGFQWLKNYDADRQLFAACLRKSVAPLKILLKTKDEATLLRGWIEHHAKIVGLENIIIFDHGSTDPLVEEIYREYHSGMQLWRYQGFVDVLHSRRCNEELYQALRNSCRYYAFLDTDEYLALTDGATYSADEQMIGFVAEGSDVDFYPGIWLQNVLGYPDRFDLGNSVGTLVSGLKWGKPILGSHLDSPDIMHHNIHLFQTRDVGRLVANILVLHRYRLSPCQRIESNLRKLASFGRIESVNELETVLRMNSDDASGMPGDKYVREIHQLAALAPDAKGHTEQSIFLRPDGRIEFQSDAQKAMFVSFIEAPHQ